MADKNQRPKVGIGVVVTHPKYPNCVLIGKRKGSYGDGHYSLPGGHLEFGESFIDCAKRELLEETGLVLHNCTIETTLNVADLENSSHFVVILVKGCVDKDSQATLTEPDRCEGWQWHSWEEFPQPAFLPVRIAKRQGYHPFQNAKDL